jgi:hypothetical protein
MTKLLPTSYLMRKKSESISPKAGMRQGYILPPLLCNIDLEFLARAIRKKKK